jgi:hypothetical protein
VSTQPTHSPGTLTSGRKAVTATATPEALSSVIAQYHWVDVTALNSNTQEVTVGASNVAHGASQVGTQLAANDTQTYYDTDISKIFVDVEVTGEGVSWTGMAK